MIQRKQTIYLLLAIICFTVTASLPIGYLVPEGMGVPSTIRCIGVIDGQTGTISYPFLAIPLILLAMNVFHALAIIFMYKNRKAQMTNCYTLIAAIVVEYIVCGALIWNNCINGTDYHYGTAFGTCLPIIAAILLLLAHKGINDDERLIRSMDRIR